MRALVRAFGDVGRGLGDITDTATDYDAGERLVRELVQFFDALKRPSEFEYAVESVYAAYEKARLSTAEEMGGPAVVAAAKWARSTAMKQAGADAAVLMRQLQAAFPSKAATVPSTFKTPAYDPAGSAWWKWALGLGLAGVVVVAAVTARTVRRLP